MCHFGTASERREGRLRKGNSKEFKFKKMEEQGKARRLLCTKHNKRGSPEETV
jgi:hypothetical protein